MNTKYAVLDILFEALTEASRNKDKTAYEAVSRIIGTVGKDLGCHSCIWADDERRLCRNSDGKCRGWCKAYECDVAKARWREWK